MYETKALSHLDITCIYYKHAFYDDPLFKMILNMCYFMIIHCLKQVLG